MIIKKGSPAIEASSPNTLSLHGLDYVSSLRKLPYKRTRQSNFTYHRYFPSLRYGGTTTRLAFFFSFTVIVAVIDKAYPSQKDTKTTTVF